MDTLILRWQLFRATMGFFHKQYVGVTMSTYMPAFIWLLSHMACLMIAKRRGVKNTTLRTMSAVLLGPFAIPFVLAAKPQKLVRI